MDNLEHAKENAKGWLASIEEMLDSQYETAAHADGWTPYKDKFDVDCFKNEDGSTYACITWQELCEAHDIEVDDDIREEAEQRIHESVLSVSVRDGWHQPGQPSEDGPEEYEILLSTGGPALRIYGRLGANCQPESAELQIQDWGTPWMRYPVPEETLLKFALCFYFGE